MEQLQSIVFAVPVYLPNLQPTPGPHCGTKITGPPIDIGALGVRDGIADGSATDIGSGRPGAALCILHGPLFFSLLLCMVLLRVGQTFCNEQIWACGTGLGKPVLRSLELLRRRGMKDPWDLG